MARKGQGKHALEGTKQTGNTHRERERQSTKKNTTKRNEKIEKNTRKTRFAGLLKEKVTEFSFWKMGICEPTKVTRQEKVG